MRWIASEGGPLVLLPSSSADVWQGIDGPPGESDYDLACGVMDYAGVVAKGGVAVLVLGDEPLQTAFVEGGGHPPALVRWIYAPSEEAALAAVTAADFNALEPLEEAELEVTEEAHRLFDAAAAGADGEGIAVRLPPGRRRVLTYVLKPTREVGVLVHLFV